MIRLLVRALLSRVSIGLLELLIVLPMALAVSEISKDLWVKPDLQEAIDIITGIAVIMIGLGVVLEERKTLRETSGLLDTPDEAWQASIDHSCHNYGAGQLVLGLLAAICMELIKIPNRIIYTGEVDDYLVAVGSFFVAVGALLLVRHAFVLFFKRKL